MLSHEKTIKHAEMSSLLWDTLSGYAILMELNTPLFNSFFVVFILLFQHMPGLHNWQLFKTIFAILRPLHENQSFVFPLLGGSIVWRWDTDCSLFPIVQFSLDVLCAAALKTHEKGKVVTFRLCLMCFRSGHSFFWSQVHKCTGSAFRQLRYNTKEGDATFWGWAKESSHVWEKTQ